MSKNALWGIAPALIAMGGCASLGEMARDTVGMKQEPVRTESDQSVRAIVGAREAARNALDAQIVLVAESVGRPTPPARNEQPPPQSSADRLIELAAVYYHVGRLSVRTQCEAFMQTLAGVDSQQAFGRDLANNLFDTATIIATVSQSPSAWATGLSTSQSSFNSVSVSTERYLMLTDSVGALRERVLEKMDENIAVPDFEAARNAQEGKVAAALNVAREAVLAVHAYGAPCTEGGIRLLISEALTASPVAVIAHSSRVEVIMEEIRQLVADQLPEDQREQFTLGSRDLHLLYFYSLVRDTRNPALPQLRAALPYVATMSDDDRQSLFNYISLLATTGGQESYLESGKRALDREFLAARQAQAAEQQSVEEAVQALEEATEELQEATEEVTDQGAEADPPGD